MWLLGVEVKHEEGVSQICLLFPARLCLLFHLHISKFKLTVLPRTKPCFMGTGKAYLTSLTATGLHAQHVLNRSLKSCMSQSTPLSLSAPINVTILLSRKTYLG